MPDPEIQVKDPEDMTPDELNQYLAGETPSQEEPVKPEEEPAPKVEEEKAEPDKQPEEDPVEKLKKEASSYRKNFYDKQQEWKQKEFEHQKAMKERELEILKLKAEAHKPLGAEELADLKEADPDAYVAYQLNQAKASGISTEIEAAQDGLKQLEVQHFGEQLNSNVTNWIAQRVGILPDQMIDANGKLNPKIAEFWGSEDYAKVAEFIDANIISTGQLPSPEMMEATYLMLFRDKAMAEATAKAADSIAHTVKKIGAQTSPLPASGDQAASPEADFENATPADIENWPASKVAAYEKWVDGKAS